MYTVNARNVTDAFWRVLNLVNQLGEREDSRNGPVLALPAPLCVVYHEPLERVLFIEGRDDNPFLNLFDGIFSLQSLNHAPFMFQFSKRFKEFSDNGETFHGHYGTRLHTDFGGRTQLEWAIDTLRADPQSRRVVLQLFFPFQDQQASADIPCNVTVALRIVDKALNITVFNRSNDIMWGLLGANAVQFSVLQEYLATAIGVPVGTYFQITNNAHAYLEQGPYQRMIEEGEPFPCPRDPYDTFSLPPLVVDPARWMAEAEQLVAFGGPGRPHLSGSGFREPFFKFVAAQALWAWQDKSLALAQSVVAPDWRRAMVDYATRKGWK